MLAYGITWGGIIVVGGAARFQGLAVPASQFPLVVSLALWSLVGLLAVALRQPARPVAQAQVS